MLEDESVPVLQSRMVYAVNKATAEVLNKLAAAPRIGELGLQFSAGWHEKNDRTKGFFDSEWGRPPSWDDVILQGPNLHIGLPFFKYPNRTMSSNKDWTLVDLEALDPDAIPITSYKPRGNRARYDASYTHWRATESGGSVPAWASYRVAWRNMAAVTGERTVIPALVPRGSTHIHAVSSAGFSESSRMGDLALFGAFLGSLVNDFSHRVTGKSHVGAPQIDRLSFIRDETAAALSLRFLRLNAVSNAYADLWAACWNETWGADTWTSAVGRTVVSLGEVEATWSWNTPLRRAVDRRQAQVEIDALVALSLGINADELVTTYRTQFPVLVGYDRGPYLYDANGRLVPTVVQQAWRRQGDATDLEDRTVKHPGSGRVYIYEPPFQTYDREADLRQAHTEFAQRFSNLS